MSSKQNQGEIQMAKNRKTTSEAPRSTGKNEQAGPKKELEPLLTISDEELYERVVRKAYELYQQRGEEHGHDLEDWLTAERLVRQELLHGPLSTEPLLEEG
jgi:hypothetical protein